MSGARSAESFVPPRLSAGGEGIAYLSFTERGRALALRLRSCLGGEVTCTRDGGSVSEWTARMFPARRALVYVGAAGIAVRAVAPHLRGKAVDPAVVVVDERGRFAVSLLSGHLGGANELARRVAAACGAQPVITTATDLGGVFAVDEWARVQGLAVVNPGEIRAVSSKLLAGERVGIRSVLPVAGEPPEGIELRTEGEPEVWVDVYRHWQGLSLAPPCLLLGIGCRRGITREALEHRFAALCQETGLLPQAVCRAATHCRKAEEAGLLNFCTGHDWPLSLYSSEELGIVRGEFTASAFVQRQLGVDNVCERGAVLASGGGPLLLRKYAGEGITFALALCEMQLDWRWRRGEALCGGPRPWEG